MKTTFENLARHLIRLNPEGLDAYRRETTRLYGAEVSGRTQPSSRKTGNRIK